ncbi:hypothetical protein C8R45DRAFT_991796 [Mycena sanguinolenta]|nr:hypothetical protein C8R45DRAFT_991796 [Mycena sanguinolenta]
MEKQNQILGDGHPETLRTMGNLARTYTDLGQYTKAKELNVVVLERRSKILGENHSDTILAMNNLAKSYSNLGKHEEARKLSEVVVEKQKQLLDHDAQTYIDLGEPQRTPDLV